MQLSKAILTDIYLQALQDTPFSSATPILKLAEKSFDPGFGGNCIDQSRKIIEKLRDFEDVNITIWRDERSHPALLVTTEGTSYYVDPYFMTHHPLAIDVGQTAKAEAYPHFGAHMSTVDVFHNGGEIHVRKHIAGLNKTEEILLKGGRLFPDEKEYKRAALRTSLSQVVIRTLSKGIAITIAYPLKPVAPIDPQKVFINDPQGKQFDFGTKDFDVQMGFMEKALNASAETITQAILDSASLYYEMRDR